MTILELTCRARGERQVPMMGLSLARRTAGRRAARAVSTVLLGGAMLSGCVSVNAPDKPIVIELNINIKQEVIYRLAADAGQTIDNNKSIF